MKHVFNKVNIFGVIMLLAMVVGCTTTTQTQNKENLLIAAGFKVIIPKTAALQQKLQTLPAGKVSLVQKNGQIYYFSRTQLTTRPTWVALASTKLISSFV
jgi:hypothetical protein